MFGKEPFELFWRLLPPKEKSRRQIPPQKRGLNTYLKDFERKKRFPRPIVFLVHKCWNCTFFEWKSILESHWPPAPSKMDPRPEVEPLPTRRNSERGPGWFGRNPMREDLGGYFRMVSLLEGTLIIDICTYICYMYIINVYRERERGSTVMNLWFSMSYSVFWHCFCLLNGLILRSNGGDNLPSTGSNSLVTLFNKHFHTLKVVWYTPED